MADVVQKAITANDVHNGYRIVSVNQFGTMQNVAPVRIVEVPDITNIENKLTDRFDEINYYSS